MIGEAGTIGDVFTNMSAYGLNHKGRDDQAQCFFRTNSPFYIGNLPNVDSIISAHDYQSVWPLDKQVEYRQELHAALHAINPRLGYWMSEYCVMAKNDEVGGGGGRDLGMNTALYVARLIHNDLVIAQARSWQWWTALSEVDYKDGLIYLDDGSKGNTGRMGSGVSSLIRDGEVRKSKLLWVLGNYARFVRPGMVRIECRVTPEQSRVHGLLASAYKGKNNRIVVVVVNLSNDEQRCDFGSRQTVDVFTTSAQANLKKSRQPASNISVPARAVITVCLRGK